MSVRQPAFREARSGARARVTAGVKLALASNAVPILFLALSVAGVLAVRLNVVFLLNELITRLARNSFLVLSLLIPVTAGMGLNFGIVMGAMAGQAALMAVTHLKIAGLAGFWLAWLIASPLAVLIGWLAGRVMNQAKGREMITSMILGFFANGIYQLIFLFLVGSLIPIKNPTILLPSGVGLRNTVDLQAIAGSIDRVLQVRVGRIIVPGLPIVLVVILCLVLRFLLRTRLGQQLRAVGQDLHVAQVSGISVDRVRIIAMILSTVPAAWGQLIFLQNIGTLNTYNSHDQVGMFAIASLLVGGATVRKATIGQALIGTFLFHTMFIVSPLAGQKLFGVPQVGEFFRVFVAYGVILVALVLHAWQSRARLSAASMRS